MLIFLSPLVRRIPGGGQKSLARYHILPLGECDCKGTHNIPFSSKLCRDVSIGILFCRCVFRNVLHIYRIFKGRKSTWGANFFQQRDENLPEYAYNALIDNQSCKKLKIYKIQSDSGRNDTRMTRIAQIFLPVAEGGAEMAAMADISFLRFLRDTSSVPSV